MLPRWLRIDARHRKGPESIPTNTTASRRLAASLQSSECETTAEPASDVRAASAGDRSIEYGSTPLWQRSYQVLQRRLRHRNPAGASSGFRLAENLRRPSAAEFMLLVAMQIGENRNQQGERGKERGPGFLLHHFVCNYVNVPRQFREAPGFSSHAPHPIPQPVEELFLAARAGDLGVSRPRGRQCMRIAS